MIALIHAYADRMAERKAEKLLETDAAAIDSWRTAVHENIKARRGRWADVAYLKRHRIRRYA